MRQHTLKFTFKIYVAFVLEIPITEIYPNEITALELNNQGYLSHIVKAKTKQNKTPKA